MKFVLSLLVSVILAGLAACSSGPQGAPPIIISADDDDWREVTQPQAIEIVASSDAEPAPEKRPQRVVKLKPQRPPAANTEAANSTVTKPAVAAVEPVANPAPDAKPEAVAEETETNQKADAVVATTKDDATAVTSSTVTATAAQIETTTATPDPASTAALVTTPDLNPEQGEEELPESEKIALGTVGDAKQEADSDSDSVLDADDKCPESVTNLPIDNNGCVTLQGFIDGIEFEPGTANLTLQANSVLNSIAQTMKSQNELRLSVITHIDSAEDAAMGVQLSKRRTLAVIRYLIGQSISGSRIRPASVDASESSSASRSGVEFRTLSN